MESRAEVLFSDFIAWKQEKLELQQDNSERNLREVEYEQYRWFSTKQRNFMDKLMAWVNSDEEVLKSMIGIGNMTIPFQQLQTFLKENKEKFL